MVATAAILGDQLAAKTGIIFLLILHTIFQLWAVAIYTGKKMSVVHRIYFPDWLNDS